MKKSDVKMLVITGFGLNCEKETTAAFEYVGAEVSMVHLNDLIAGKRSLKEFQILAFIGGFSFGDHLGAGTVLPTGYISVCRMNSKNLLLRAN